MIWASRNKLSDDTLYGYNLFFLELGYHSPEDAASVLQTLMRLSLPRRARALQWLEAPKTNVALLQAYGIRNVAAVFSVWYYYALARGWFTLANWLQTRRLIDPGIRSSKASFTTFGKDPFSWAVRNGRADPVGSRAPTERRTN